MKVSYNEDLANHIDLESCAVEGNLDSEALTGGDAGRELSREITQSRAPTLSSEAEGETESFEKEKRENGEGPARSESPSMYPSTTHGSREIPRLTVSGISVRIGNSKEVIR